MSNPIIILDVVDYIVYVGNESYRIAAYAVDHNDNDTYKVQIYTYADNILVADFMIDSSGNATEEIDRGDTLIGLALDLLFKPSPTIRGF